jgi:hypothetical protein
MQHLLGVVIGVCLGWPVGAAGSLGRVESAPSSRPVLACACLSLRPSLRCSRGLGETSRQRWCRVLCPMTPRGREFCGRAHSRCFFQQEPSDSQVRNCAPWTFSELGYSASASEYCTANRQLQRKQRACRHRPQAPRKRSRLGAHQASARMRGSLSRRLDRRSARTQFSRISI